MARNGMLDARREGAMRERYSAPPMRRTSLDEAYKSSSEDEYDELDLLHNHADIEDRKTRRRYTDAPDTSISPTRTNEDLKREFGMENPLLPKRRRAWKNCWGCCHLRRRWFVVLGIVIAALILGLLLPGVWVYKHAPADGVRTSLPRVECPAN